MMVKMRLKSRAPSEGARRLAWWIGTQCLGDVRRASIRLGMSTVNVERMLAGDVVPGTEMVANAWNATHGLIQRRDWFTRPQGGWFDRPVPHYDRIAA